MNCIITSPPYWSLRKYDIPDLIWDGEEGCKHNFDIQEIEHPMNRDGATGNLGNKRSLDFAQGKIQSGFCIKCSSWRGQLGLEPTIHLYLKHLMQIMDECWRVLRNDGTMWVNLGDSYSGSGGYHQPWHNNEAGFQGKLMRGCKPTKDVSVPPKSLCLIPYRFAIEMVNRGWILRNVIIWHKPNCMPSSVKDRFTVDFEPVFFFVKSRKYRFEMQYEPHSDWDRQFRRPKNSNKDGSYKRDDAGLVHAWNVKELKYNPQGRNRRCVWTISTQPYAESHFATFPEALIEPMIRAGCPKEICVKCGKAREKIYKFDYVTPETRGSTTINRKKRMDFRPDEIFTKVAEQIGLTSCGCNAGFRPGVVLDPFCGSGTTMRVAEKLNRVGIGFDLAYEDLQDYRMKLVQKEMF